MKMGADRDVLALALQGQQRVLVTSDRALARRAQSLGVVTIDVARIVQLLCEAGIIRSAKRYLDLMLDRGFGISPALYEDVLRAVGESEQS